MFLPLPAGRLTFIAPLIAGQSARHTSLVEQAAPEHGRSGPDGRDCNRATAAAVS